MSLLGATVLTAIATLALAVFAFTTAIFAWLAFRKQSREVAAIERQVDDQKELTARQADLLKVQSDQLELQQRQFDEDQAVRRRAQAAQVFIQVDDPGGIQAQVVLRASAWNTSSQPVYDLWVQWRTDDGEFGTPEARPLLVPRGAWHFDQAWTIDAGISGVDVSLDFRDAAGLRWRTTGRGILTELCTDVSPRLARSHCTFAPRHAGRHSWEVAGP